MNFLYRPSRKLVTLNDLLLTSESFETVLLIMRPVIGMGTIKPFNEDLLEGRGHSLQ